MRHLLLICGLWLFASQTYAQDVILQTNGEELKGKVLTITPEQVTYVSSEPGRTDTLRLASSAVFLIRYANGTKEVLRNPAAPADEPLALSKEEAYSRGRLDARKYYKAHGAFWGTYAATVATIPYTAGLGGLATGVAVGASKPKARTFIVPETKLLQDPNYVAGYSRQAQHKKIGSVAGGFGAGVGTLAAGIIVLAILFSNGI